MCGTYVHMYTKYEVSMFNAVAGEVCTDDDANADDNSNANDDTNDDGQNMIV